LTVFIKKIIKNFERSFESSFSPFKNIVGATQNGNSWLIKASNLVIYAECLK